VSGIYSRRWRVDLSCRCQMILTMLCIQNFWAFGLSPTSDVKTKAKRLKLQKLVLLSSPDIKIGGGGLRGNKPNQFGRREWANLKHYFYIGGRKKSNSSIILDLSCSWWRSGAEFFFQHRKKPCSSVCCTVSWPAFQNKSAKCSHSNLLEVVSNKNHAVVFLRHLKSRSKLSTMLNVSGGSADQMKLGRIYSFILVAAIATSLTFLVSPVGVTAIASDNSRTVCISS
jgi:hypothetical protein